MTQTFTRLPLLPRAQKFTITLAGTVYNMRTTYNAADEGGWTLDIGDEDGAILIAGIPMVTGADLLQQYRYMDIGGSLFVVTDRNAGDVPTFNGLGVTSQVFFVTPA